jgi:hypothetical protein
MNTFSTFRSYAPRRSTVVAALAALLAFGSASAHAGDTARLELLAAAGSSPVAKVQYRHDDRDYRHGDRHRGHRGGDRRHGHHGYDRHDRGHFGHPIRERAHYYASTAVRQAEEARALGFYSDHPRWRTGYSRHYRWALDASPHRIDEEIRRRARKLRELRSWGYGLPSWANDHRHGPSCRH